ncbi:hypothetical protein QJS83_02290 [Bdellovibrio sp. 22V]|uniref:hypothetical protein n=1 Tax=Bdellovibrio sp. 22V TaxID=3044166 RepID=UPI0025430F60|nr:hypothetical protein [Bdellovibrio sp. 22V]WII72698.1 hypothetical protein QJS83_02290 [Bdellovibrio sp. 22V]
MKTMSLFKAIAVCAALISFTSLSFANPADGTSKSADASAGDSSPATGADPAVGSAGPGGAGGGGGAAGGGDPCANTEEGEPGTPPMTAATGTVKPEEQNKDLSGKGNKEACEGIKKDMDDLKTVISSYRGNGLVNDHFEKINAAYEQYTGWRKSCLSNHSRAATACLESWSPDLAGTASNINILLSTLGGMAVKDTCNNFSKAMDLAKAGLTAYTSACGLMKAGCGFSCVKSRSGLEDMEKYATMASKSAQCAPTNATDGGAACNTNKQAYLSRLQAMLQYTKQEQNKADKRSISGKTSLCTGKYAQLAASAATGIMGLINSAKQGEKCEEESNGTGGTDPTVAAGEKCADPANAQLPECICKANPRTPGCSNSYQKPGESSLAQVGTGVTDKANVNPTRGPSDIDTSSGNGLGDMGRNESSAGDGGLPGAPTGGGAGLSGSGGGGSGGVAGKDEASTKKGLNTDILSGAGGGGGGGFGSFGGGGSNYRAYLPGGAKDPSKGVAGQQQAWKNEVTGQGGKSNWDKVKERYRDNRNTLLNN